MKARTLAACGKFAMLAALAGLAGCGGGSKPAESAADTPKGDDTSSSSAGSTAGTSDNSPPPSGGGGSSSSSGGGGGSGGDTGTSAASGGQTPYDKDAVGVELKRAARQVKANCGAATDESGAATGPWGKMTANLVLGRNGHIKQVTVPPEYDGKPVGICIAHAFQKIVFPPYAGSSDATLDFDLEVVKPKR